MTPEDILPIYDRAAKVFAAERGQSLVERRWLDRALAHTTGRRVLDLGCGPGKPIATYLMDRRCQVTGVDGSRSMVDLFLTNLPRARCFHLDMRGLELQERFDVILAWNSLFHLKPDDQRAMFPVFADHAVPGAMLMFTAGPAAGEVMGNVGRETIYHASLDPDEYRVLLRDNGFEDVAYVPEDPTCDMHTVWLARYKP